MTATPRRRRGHGDPAPYQRASDGRWVGVVWLPNPGGSKIRKLVYGKTQKEAQKKRDQLKASVASGVLPNDATLSQWLRYWLDVIAPARRKATTIDRNRSYVETWIIPTIGAVRLQDLQVDHVRLLISTMQKHVSERTKKPLAPRTILKCQMVLQAALTKAVEDGKILRNVAKLADSPTPKEPNLRRLEPDEAFRIIDKTTDVRERARLAVALYAALRQGEALALRWECVKLAPDGSGGEIDVRVAATCVRGLGMWEATPKTDRSIRRVPLGPAAAQMLLAWREVSGGVGYVFHGYRGPEVIEGSRRDYEVWVRAEKRAGVEHVRLHAARGSAASLMSSRVPAFVAAEILGDSETVMQRYYTRGSSEQRELAAKSVEPEQRQTSTEKEKP